MSFEPPPPFGPDGSLPDLPPLPPEPEPLSVGQEALRGVWLEKYFLGTADLTSPPTGVQVDERGGLRLEPSYDVQMLAVYWAIAAPIAISTDVSQRTWYLYQRGAELPDQYAKRIAAEPVVSPDGRTLRARLVARPDGPLPEEVAGPSPAYDLKLVGGRVEQIELG